MAYRGGGGRAGDRGDQRPPYGHGGAGGRGDQHQRPPYGHGGAGAGAGGRPFEWPPPVPPTTPRPVPSPPPSLYAVPMGYCVPMDLPHQGAYGVPMAVYRPSGQAPPPYRVPVPAGPLVSFSPAPPAATVTIRATPAAPSSSSAPAPPPRQPPAATPPQSASTPASVPAPAASSAPSTAALAKEVEKKLFVSETALAPPAAIAQQETAAAAGAGDDASDVDLAPVSKKGLAHPARPGLATVGKKVMIRANHFLVNVADNILFHYDVAINPESKSRATNREVLNELIKLHGKTSLGGKLPAYDGRKSLYTAGSLLFESEEFVVTLVDPEKKEKERVEREYKITIRIAGRTDMYHLQQFLRGRQRDMPQETIQVLDVVLRESPSWNYVTVSRSFFSTTFGHRGDIGEGLECWRGYYQSLRPTQMGLSLNIDISATSFFKLVTVIKFVEEFLNLRDTSRPLSDRDRVKIKIKKALRGVRIETSHQQDQIRRYKITGVTPIPMSQLIFSVDDKGTRQTVVQYFLDKYNYRLKYGSWPCLQAGRDSRPVYLPMEVCKILEGQRYSKKLNDRQVTNILRATCKRPQEREQSIHDMVLHNKYADDKFAQEFGIQVSSDLVTVPARVLPPPLLKYHDSGREKTCAPSVGQWNMINKKMINGGTIDNWTCLNFSRMRPDEVQRFCMDLTHMCNATGMVVNPRPFVEVRSAAPNHIENALRDVHRRATQMLAQQGVRNQLQLLIVILPEVSGSYGKIKRVCETDIGIVSQCCLPKHASRPNKQYLENVALKINVKVGGRNTVLERAFVRNGIPFVSEVPTIIFGADVTHPPPGEDSASSIAAVVASMDWPEITKYRGLVSAQPHRQEIIEDLFTVSKDPQKGHNVNGGMIRELLIAFRKKTNRRPERIIFYRDGVSEGQFSHVLLHEMDAIRKACASLEEGYLPPVTFVVVQKRHHTRLFPEVHGKRDLTDKSGNILPGTVVDQKICHPTEFDFYLCSHAGIQGTSRPTHYHVLYDENHFTADALQSLTNNLCYTFPVDDKGTRQTVVQYFWDKYNYRLKYVSWPCLQAGGDSRPAYLPIEVCKKGQRSSMKLNDRQVTNILSATCKRPQEREQMIDEVVQMDFSGYIKVTVVLLQKVDVYVLKFSTVEFTVMTAMKKCGVYFHDIYFLFEGRTVAADATLMKSGTLYCRHRLRGGHRNAPIQFKNVINEARSGGYFFEWIDLPVELHHKGVDSVVDLGDYARHLFSLLTKCLEYCHEDQCSFRGFNINNIWYYPDDGIIKIHKECNNRLDQLNYKLDLQSLSVIIRSCFHFSDQNHIHYPMHLRRLGKWISKLKNNGTEFSSKITRSEVFLNSACWSAVQRIKFFDSLMILFHKLPFTDKTNFKNVLGTQYRTTPGGQIFAVSLRSFNWKIDISSTAMHHFLSSDPNKIYHDEFLGRLDFSRCFITHIHHHLHGATEKEADAAVYLLAPDQISQLRHLLLSNFTPSVQTVSATRIKQAPVLPAGQQICSVSSMTIPTSSTSNLYECFGFEFNPFN